MLGWFTLAVILIAVVAIPYVFPAFLIDTIGRLLVARPEDHEGWAYYGHLLTRTGDYEKAISAYQQAILHRPDYVKAWQKLGDLYIRLGRDDAADEAYRMAIDE